MRLIIFVRVPGQVDEIPLDIQDDRPTESVLKDILLITKFSSKNQVTENYFLSKNGKKLDATVSLSTNGINNADTLDLNYETESNVGLVNARASHHREGSTTQDVLSAKTSSSSESDTPPVPGRKIDFD